MPEKKIVSYISEKTGEAKTLSEWSKFSGISSSTLFCRLKRGMNIDEAIAASSKQNPIKKIITDPKSGETHSVEEWAEITGRPAATIYNRIYRYKWSVEQALYGEKTKVSIRPKETYDHIDLTGRKFGKLTVLRRADEDYEFTSKGKPKTEWKWVCQCDCENHTIVEVIQHNLLNGHTKNCGCSNPNAFIDMTGKKFGHLTVLGRAPDKFSSSGEKIINWYCKCDCGNEDIVVVNGRNLRNGHTTSCGCRIGNPKHGMHGTRIYNIYRGMVRRCYNQNDKYYYRYGGRGIYICDEWYGYGDGFINFYNWSMSHGYLDDLTIDRIDNDGPYAPWNCRWATMKTQCNNRSNNDYITYNGVTMTSSEWAEKLGVNSATLIARHNKGWSDEDVIEIPINYLINKVSSSSGETHTIAEWSAICGINKGTLYDRIFRYNWTVDNAIVVGSTNPYIYNYIDPRVAYAMQHPGYIAPLIPPAMYYVDILGRYYTPEEWNAHQAVFFD